jgi:hypothetical protein
MWPCRARGGELLDPFLKREGKLSAHDVRAGASFGREGLDAATCAYQNVFVGNISRFGLSCLGVVRGHAKRVRRGCHIGKDLGFRVVGLWCVVGGEWWVVSHQW